MLAEIRDKLRRPISYVQIDPNTLCNCACWYCPNRYTSIPSDKRAIMSPSLLEKILSEISQRDGILIDTNLWNVYTAHYNEVLLYPHFELLLTLLKGYSLGTTVLTNGIALSREKVDLMVSHSNVIKEIIVDLPAGNPEDYHLFTLHSPEIFDLVIENVDYCSRSGLTLSIVVNGVDDTPENLSQLGVNAPNILPNSLKRQLEQLRAHFPNIKIEKVSGLIDRIGILRDHKILDSSSFYPPSNAVITDCGSGRVFSWVHINARGDLFVCCQDYFMNSTFGNIEENSLSEIWYSDAHVEAIQQFLDNQCRKCLYASCSKIEYESSSGIPR